MSEKKITGISFPFRISKRGGVTMSSTDGNRLVHVEEGIIQSLNTHRGERGMNANFFSDIDTLIFSPNDISSQTLIEYQVREALRNLNDYIEVEEIAVESEDNKVFVTITYTNLISNELVTTSRIRIGERI